MDSDLDIVVLTNTPAYADARTWTHVLDGEVIRRQQWGPPREVRLRCLSGLEVEMASSVSLPRRRRIESRPNLDQIRTNVVRRCAQLKPSNSRSERTGGQQPQSDCQ
jgi:hypothetical protein